jgi:hypothetical protein
MRSGNYNYYSKPMQYLDNNILRLILELKKMASLPEKEKHENPHIALSDEQRGQQASPWGSTFNGIHTQSS